MKTARENLFEDNDNSIDTQLIKLIGHYWEIKKVYLYFDDNMDRESAFKAWFSAVTYFFYDRKLLDSYKEDKAKFSTFVFNAISLNWYIFYYQVLYNMTQEQARLLYRKTKISKEEGNKLLNVYYSYFSLDQTCESEDTEENRQRSLSEIHIVTDDKNSMDNKLKQIENKETLKMIMEIVNDKKYFKDRAKEILLYHIKNGYNTRQTIEHFNISRQRLDQITKKLRRLAKDKIKTIE